MKSISIILLSFIVFISGCVSPTPTGNIILNGTDVAANEISKLPPLDINKVETFEQYKKFADGFNAMAKILNEKTDIFEVPYFEATKEEYEKVSKVITEYAPLIDNYNDVIFSAKAFNKNDNKTIEKFYTESGQFAFETAIIVGMVFASASYAVVGTAYRASGLNVLAFKCGACVSVVLQETHWALRTALVEGSSQIAQGIITLTEGRFLN